MTRNSTTAQLAPAAAAVLALAPGKTAQGLLARQFTVDQVLPAADAAWG